MPAASIGPRPVGAGGDAALAGRSFRENLWLYQ